MACTVNHFTDILQNESPGGVVVFDFYSTTNDATPDAGGSVIEVSGNGVSDFNNAIPGFYYFTHTVGEGDCQVSTQYAIQVVARPDAGIGDTVNLCVDDAPINIFSLLTGTPQLTGVWSGSGVGNAGHSANTGVPTDDMFDPGLSGEGVFTFIYTVGVVPQEGYIVSNCENCNAAQATITFNVTSCNPPIPCNTGDSALVHVCRTAACAFNLYERLGGTPEPNGYWTLLPGAPQVIVIGGGYLGTVNFVNAQVGTYQFQYALDNVDPTCTNTSIVTVQVVAEPNAGNNMNLVLCETMPNTNLFNLMTGNPTPGGVWSISPQLPAGEFSANGFINPAPGDAGTYTVTYTVTTATPNNPCGTICNDVSTHTINIYANCNAGANGSATVCQDQTFTLNAATLLGGTPGGTWFVFGQSIPCNNVFGSAVFSVNGGAQQNQQGNYLADLSVLSNFANLGCISFIYRCEGGNPLCYDTASFMLTVLNCPAACNAAVTISAVGCALSSSITGTCPTPIYQWQQFISGNWINISGANASTYTGANNGTYRLQVTNCTNCGTLLSNQITVSCPPPPSCVITCSLTYNTTLQRLEAVITNTGAAGGSMPYQFNKYSTNNANCLNCSGVGVAACSGNVIIPAMGSVQVNCNVAQTNVEQCWRFVVSAQNGACNNTLCCAKIPATAANNNYWIESLPQNTEITGVTVTIGGVDVVWNKTNFPAQFNCADYESTFPNALMNGNNNCWLAQLVHDINQRLTAGGYLGDAYIIQSQKSSSIRIEVTNIVFKNLIKLNGTTIPFTTTTAPGCELPPNTFHFQETASHTNFNIILDASNGGTFNIFTQMLQKAMPDIPNTGTFTQATGNTILPGCIEITTDCLASVGATITIQNGGANHGLLTWSSFVPLTNPNNCYFNLRYVFQMLNTGCEECTLINIIFKP